ncbi:MULTISPECIES: VENN motif pre-toxin domain-containing protein [Pasteurellaceae]|uniref:VENN motif pre-toxin domain-containing protein n=1 Tax=Pasteurella atlantica TaxID=2827233 RepID=A0AAW8CNE7_9PAST|nr:VENN motif pre-toxin domain-containing protein [Pasteurella atlantica]MBR0573017.1 VENN motif pre-toxin domain-containing protein [Pasteurella atlantica]MDP8038856.1 VENN motif pre-toxin domain-containing protein [Pasteurella atlantica]MDP8041035.1 VENN motif pre-toxin domain-containing protein [Pasteurella atlantica]MDP8043171.1 VENN motif pre-toxin domain-containing protein [Pasteurella atlantica]MDP8045257.1 VENN motif pre-toxin domain-containing protein [Pasteurella atlantica]
MVGDYLVEQGQENNLTPEDKARILNIAKLTAGSVALVAGVDVNAATNSAGVAVENNSLKIVTTTYKVGKKVFKIATKKGKVTIKDLKKALKEEGFDIADDLITLFDGELTIEDGFAVLDLVVGTELNNANKGKAATKIKEIFSKSMNNTALIGQSFGKVGTVVHKPNINITQLTDHYIKQKLTRGVTSEMVMKAVKNPKVVLKQSSGNHLYLTTETAVVLNSQGKIITTYSKDYFDNTIKTILGVSK